MRIFVAICVSFVICIGIFFGMHLMTSSSNTGLNKKSEMRQLVYLREKNDTDVKKKKRIKPKEEKKHIMKKIQLPKQKLEMKVKQKVDLKPIKFESKIIDISKISSLSGALVGMKGDFFDANSLKTLRKVNPKYPRHAKLRRQEGFVKLAFNINQHGLVTDIKILDSKPKNVFEKSAITAIKKWRFRKDKSLNNASITFNYRLAR